MDTDNRFPSNNIHNVKYKNWNFTADAKGKRDDNVEKEQHEKLSVRKAYAVGYPRTVMIHIEHTALTGGAVMTSILVI